MTSALRGRARAAGLAIAAAALSGALLHLGTGLQPIWWLTWLAPLPVAWAATRLGAWTAFAAAAVAWTIGALNEWSFLRGLSVPAATVVAAMVTAGLVFGLGVVLLRAFARGGAALRASLALPAVWVSYEFVLASTSVHGTFGSLAYTQAENLIVLQLAAAVGSWGVTFAVLWLPAAAAVALAGTVPAARRRRLLSAVAAAAVAGLGFGLWRLRAPAPPASEVVGLAASVPLGDVMPSGTIGARLLREYLAQAEALARRGARLVVLPEKVAEVDGPGAAELDAAWQAVADRTLAILVVGVALSEKGATFNEARVYRAGAAPAAYRKHHLLPGWESRFTPGTDRFTAAGAGGRFGLAVCKDMDFPMTARAYGNDAAALLVVPAWDFDADGWLHSRMAVLRGVEGGFAVVRAARQGLLTVSDARGRILAEQQSATAAFSTLATAVPIRAESTLYARVGDAFGWACLAGVAALLLTVRGARTRRPPAAGSAASISSA